MPPWPATPSILCPANSSPTENSRIRRMLTRAHGRTPCSASVRRRRVDRKEAVPMDHTGHLVAAGAGDYVKFRALGTRYVVTAEQTGGAFALVEHDLEDRKSVV